MPKPICVIKVDMQSDFGTGEKANLYKLMIAFEERLPDYHVFVIPQADTPEEPKERVEFEVFCEKDFTEIQYKELKDIITDSLKNKKK